MRKLHKNIDKNAGVNSSKLAISKNTVEKARKFARHKHKILFKKHVNLDLIDQNEHKNCGLTSFYLFKQKSWYIYVGEHF